MKSDVFISGGGIAGLTAAACFSKRGFKVVLADPNPPVRASVVAGSDLRSTAFLQPAKSLLEFAGVWAGIEQQSTPLENLRVINLALSSLEVQTDRLFASSDLGDEPFGWNLPNWLVRKHLMKLLAKNDLVTILETGFKSILARDREARVVLKDGTTIQCQLAIAADGYASPLRQAAGIEVSVTRYGQKALAFVVNHDLPHQNTSTELYHSGGAFTLVPLSDQNNRPCSAVVWMNDGPEALRLENMPNDAFSTAATQRSASVLGDLELISPKRLWPIITQSAESLVSQRMALIAEAAHVLPPIGAQGLNTSLADIKALIDILDNGAELGSESFLNSYQKRRARDITGRARVIDLYNRICKSSDASTQAIRSVGLAMTHDIAPLRHWIMKAGLG